MPIIQRLGSASARGFGFGKTGVTHQRVVQESATITDATNRAVSYDSVISETSTATDAIASLLNSLNQVLEVATGSDSIQGERGYISVINETATISDLISTIGNQNITVAEIATATDAVSNIGSFDRSVTETGSITDTPQGSILTINNIVEAGTASDVITLGRTTSGVISEVALGLDETERLALANGVINETASGADSVVATSLGYWIATLTNATENFGLGVAVDSGNNVYVMGITNYVVNSSGSLQLAKYNSLGQIEWQRSLSSGRATGSGDVAVDSSGNVYAAATYTISSVDYWVLAKYDTYGILAWQKQISFGSSSATSNPVFGITLDSSGNIYVTGYSTGYNTGGYQHAITHKYDGNGTVIWQRRYGDSVAANAISNYTYGVAVDSSGNVYVVGVISNNPYNLYTLITTKYNSSGTIQWQRSLYGANSTSTRGYGIAVDSSSNVYVTGSYSTNTEKTMVFAKYDTNGTLQWQRSLGSQYSIRGLGVAVDSSGDPYFCGYSFNSSGISNAQIVKYNSSGTIQWQRSLSGTGSSSAASLAIDADGRVCICGETDRSGIPGFILAKLPSDGSATGTYSVGGFNYTYAATTFTSSANRTTGSPSYTSNTATRSITSSSLVDSVTTLTSSVTDI